MKRIVAFICILVLCFSLCACGKSPRSGNLPRTSQSAIESQSVSESDSISKDIYPSEPIDYEEYISKVQYDEDVRIDAGALIDNETPVSSFLQQQGKVSSVDTEAVLNYGRRFSRYNDDTAPDRSIDWVEKSLGQKVLFVRSGNEFQNSKTNENGIRCYTVFESEKGGWALSVRDKQPDKCEFRRITASKKVPIHIQYEDFFVHCSSSEIHHFQVRAVLSEENDVRGAIKNRRYTVVY